MMGCMQRTTVRLPDELDVRLRHEAKRRGMTRSERAREAIEAHLAGPRNRRKLLAASTGASGHDDLSERIEQILSREVGSGHGVRDA
jgi:metal-responsive CopG/Arc/MetJ family transcriptional regulator